MMRVRRRLSRRQAALTQSGGNLVLNGQAALNQRVFYDVLSNRILGQAPDTTVLELGV